jgi:hypothetical protein
MGAIGQTQDRLWLPALPIQLCPYPPHEVKPSLLLLARLMRLPHGFVGKSGQKPQRDRSTEPR